MNMEKPVITTKGRKGEIVFAIALFLTLVVAAAVAFFVFSHENKSAEKLFEKTHQDAVQQLSQALAGAADRADALVETCKEMEQAQMPFALQDFQDQNTLFSAAAFRKEGMGIDAKGQMFAAVQSDALQSALNSPYPAEIVYSLSPFAEQKQAMYTAAFEDKTDETIVIAAQLSLSLLLPDMFAGEENKAVATLVVSDTGEVIEASAGQEKIINLLAWFYEQPADAVLQQQLREDLRDRRAGMIVLSENQNVTHRIAYTPIEGTDWLIAQIEWAE